MTDAGTTEKIWRLLSTRLKSFLLSRVSDDQVASDLLQETFLRIHEKLDTVQDSQRLESWVFQIARNLIADYYRSKGRSETDLDTGHRATSPVLKNLNEEVLGWIPFVVENLPEIYRETVRLYELEGVSQQEIADRLGISLSGAKSRVQRGRKQLKQMLDDCCSFELDRYGNVLDYEQQSLKSCCGPHETESGD